MVVDVRVQVGGIHVSLAKAGDRLMRRICELETDGIGARGGTSEIRFKGVCLPIAAGERSVWNVFQQKFARRGDDGSVIVLGMVDGSGFNVGRNDDCRHSNAEASEIERRVERVWTADPEFAVRIDGGGRWNV